MSEELEEIFSLCDMMFVNADIDFDDLMAQEIDEQFFDDYNNTRIVNSFLFNFSKLQDKIGAKLFKKVLYELKEIDSFSVPMIDVLNRLEKLEIIKEAGAWDSLREIRNALAHEYPLDIEERIENIHLVLKGYMVLKGIYKNLKASC
ncbi:hypothetical protein MNB_SV-13-2093 [hydrothermal vent metagenome]|uniref:DUF4145 domain-containing protein n=1 Tax=hydrothermal vent metagenome TaxID=652676 RepID=A0A1W1CES0_9ZZZZ